MVMSLCGQVEHHVASAWLVTKVSVILLGLVMTTALLYNNKWNADFRTKYLGGDLACYNILHFSI
ncbi:response regulator [Orientia tsutsugamushi str. Gilliam]|uniref:Response regulator n=1 Tax=Orientia tsutsugamushi str. Gilliam TaxID=1359184 RepID=A0A0F3M5K0_ORITS|nr:hypothetical protein [Orientia tsutsugamushi]KJV50946.1 response regulator [Orientia tsutsugamushi str. Gilliam]